MTGFDFVIAFVVLFGLWRGFQAGLVKSLLSLVSWFVALVVAAKSAKSVAPWFSSFVTSADLQLAFGFLAVVLIVITVLSLIGKLIAGALKGLKLEFVDRFLGGVFGAAKGILVVLIFINLTASLLSNFDFFRQSVLAKALLPYAPVATQASKDLLQKGMNEIAPSDSNEDDTDNGDNQQDESQNSEEGSPTLTQIALDHVADNMTAKSTAAKSAAATSAPLEDPPIKQEPPEEVWSVVEN